MQGRIGEVHVPASRLMFFTPLLIRTGVLNGNPALRDWRRLPRKEYAMGKIFGVRKGNTPINVYCLPEEKALIQIHARQVGHSASSYLRAIALGYTVESLLDYEHVQELARINGDLGRLGGLLKLWLTDDEKLGRYDVEDMSKIIAGVIKEILANQALIRSTMAGIVSPSASVLAAKNLAAKTEQAHT